MGRTTNNPVKAGILGAGNLAKHLAIALTNAGTSIEQVWNRSRDKGQALADSLNAILVSDPNELDPDLDLYILAVSDDAIEEVSRSLPDLHGIVVHTSGAMPMDVLQKNSGGTGVLYPLQTFSEGAEVNWGNIPICYEGSTPKAESFLKELAAEISNEVVRMDSHQRRSLHIAAVFACNFSNHMYAIAERYLERDKVPFRLLVPLIQKTAENVGPNSPFEVQTGPAVRKDQGTIDSHSRQLEEDGEQELKRIYELITQHIIKTHYE